MTFPAMWILFIINSTLSPNQPMNWGTYDSEKVCRAAQVLEEVKRPEVKFQCVPYRPIETN